MTLNEKELLKKFIKIRNRGWVKSIRKGNNGVGITFENLLGLEENGLEIPDYNGIEIKTKRYFSSSYITLFSCKPEGPRYHEVERIKDEFGYPHKVLRQYKVLNNSVYCNTKNKIGINYYFQLHIDRKFQKIYLMVFDLNGCLIEKEVYWDFDTLEEKIKRKLNKLALIKAYSKKDKVNGEEYFKYQSLKFYYFKDFYTFINLLEEGVIRLNFKLNITTRGDNIGKIHDHGTSFDILEKDLYKLYNCYDIMHWFGTKKRNIKVSNK